MRKRQAPKPMGEDGVGGGGGDTLPIRSSGLYLWPSASTATDQISSTLRVKRKGAPICRIADIHNARYGNAGGAGVPSSHRGGFPQVSERSPGFAEKTDCV